MAVMVDGDDAVPCSEAPADRSSTPTPGQQRPPRQPGPQEGQGSREGRGNSHAKAVSYLNNVYQHVKSGFGNDHTCQNAGSLDYGNLQYGEVSYKGMEPLYTALGLRKTDKFYDLGSGTGKLVLYVALRGEAKSSVGLEVGERRHCQAEEACSRLTKELKKEPLDSCSNYSVVLADIRQQLYTDATVAVLSNLCMDVSVQSRVTDNLMRCSGLRRLITTVPMPPHPRLHLVRTVRVACTWAKVSAWAIYDVLPVQAKRRLPSSVPPTHHWEVPSSEPLRPFRSESMGPLGRHTANRAESQRSRSRPPCLPSRKPVQLPPIPSAASRSEDVSKPAAPLGGGYHCREAAQHDLVMPS